jgi:hypothetical protein
MRGIKKEFINDLNEGVLKPFLDNVKVDDALCLEIRGNYINIYYRGGNLFKITPAKNKGYRVYFDLGYSKLHRHRLEDINEYDCASWIENTPILKSEMDRYLSGHPKLEREFQQLIERENNTSSIAPGTDYFIADIEYANWANGSRFDMLAVKWRSLGKGIDRKYPRKATLSFIEVKYGDKALKGGAGVQKHVADIVSFIKNDDNRRRITEEVSGLFNQKYKLGLMASAPSEVDIQPNCPLEFILLVGNHNPAGTVLNSELQSVYESKDYQEMRDLGCEMKIARASLLGYGLYDNDECMIPLEAYLGH